MRNENKRTTRQMLYEDNLFREAVKEAARIEGENLLQENQELSLDNAGISQEKQEEFKRRLEKACEDKKRRENRCLRISIMQRVAVILLVFGTVITISFFSVDAFRVKVMNLIMEIKSEYTEFQLEDEQPKGIDGRIVDWTNAYVPTYIPEGFSIESSENGKAFKSITLVNQDGKVIDYAEYSEAVSMNYDTEGAELRDITVNGEVGTLVIKNDNYSIIWTHSNLIFVVMTQLNEEETLKIAENIKFIK